MNPDLEKHVNDARARGLSDDAIRTSLYTAGWNPSDVDAMLLRKTIPATPQQLPSTFKGGNELGSSGVFSWNGRIGRLRYFLIGLDISIIGGIIVLIIDFFSRSAGNILSTLIIVAIEVACFILVLFNAIKRLHDVEKSGWWWFAILIPLYNIYFGLMLLFREGTDGSNQYGDAPRRASFLDIFISILLVTAVIGTLVFTFTKILNASQNQNNVNPAGNIFNVTSTTSQPTNNTAPSPVQSSGSSSSNQISLLASPATIDPEAGSGLGNMGAFSWSSVPNGSTFTIPCVAGITMEQVTMYRNFECGTPNPISSSGSIILLFGTKVGNLKTKIIGQINGPNNTNQVTAQINVVPDTTAKTLVVTAPQTDTVLHLGQPYTIKWQTKGYPADAIFNITLETLAYGYSATSYESIANVPNTGSFTWTPSAANSAGIAHANASTTYEIEIEGYLATTPASNLNEAVGFDYATSGMFSIH